MHSPFVLVFYCCITDYNNFSGLRQHTLISHSSCAGVQAQLSCILCSGSHKAGIKVLARAGDSSEPWVLCQVHMVVGRIHFIAATELMVACFFGASRRDCLWPLEFLLKGSPDEVRPTQNNLSSDRSIVGSKTWKWIDSGFNYDDWQLEFSFDWIENNKEMWSIWHSECCGRIRAYYTQIHSDQ